MFTRAEAAAASLVTCLTAAIVLAYAADAVGLILKPIPILVLSLAAAIGVVISARPSTLREPQGRPEPSRRATSSGRADVWAFVATVGGIAVWLLWLAWPHLLPIGGGSDLTHHLLLIDYIDRTGHLPHDRALAPYLAEMLDYTPGAHLLAVLAGRWMRTDGLHAVYSVVALSVAIKIGVVFLIARRVVDRTAAALVAPLALLLPHNYVLGSFTHDSFLAQVVAELFAVTAWWAIVCWDHEKTALAATIFAVMGAATFLTWPVWVGPIVLTFAIVAWANRRSRDEGPAKACPERARPSTLREPQGRPERRRRATGSGRASRRAGRSVLPYASVALVPIATLAVVHTLGRTGTAVIMAGASGSAPIPTPAVTGWILPVAGALGTIVAFSDRRARTVPLLLAAIALQAAALVLVARARGAEAPYLALKMVYLAIYPLAVGAAVAIDRLPGRSAALVLAAALSVAVARVVVTTPRPTPVISNQLLDAGRWARAHVPPACVDYLVADDDSAYWLHLVMLGNPRAAPRSLASDTFDPQKAVVRWILPGGLPYAIAEDVDALPRDIRTNVDVLERFGRAGVLKRRDSSSCP